jgi:hypothetical protein
MNFKLQKFNLKTFLSIFTEKNIFIFLFSYEVSVRFRAITSPMPRFRYNRAFTRWGCQPHSNPSPPPNLGGQSISLCPVLHSKPLEQGWPYQQLGLASSRSQLTTLSSWCKYHWWWRLNFRHRASCILGQAFRYTPENAIYILNQQIYFIIWYLLDRASLI